MTITVSPRATPQTRAVASGLYVAVFAAFVFVTVIHRVGDPRSAEAVAAAEQLRQGPAETTSVAAATSTIPPVSVRAPAGIDRPELVTQVAVVTAATTAVSPTHRAKAPWAARLSTTHPVPVSAMPQSAAVLDAATGTVPPPAMVTLVPQSLAHSETRKVAQRKRGTPVGVSPADDGDDTGVGGGVTAAALDALPAFSSLLELPNVRRLKAPILSSDEASEDLIESLPDAEITRMKPFDNTSALPKAWPSVTVYNNGTACERGVDNRKNATDPPLDDEFLRQCGGPVTGRAALIPPTYPDAMLDCSVSAERTYERIFWNAGYIPERAEFEAMLREDRMKEGGPVIARLFSDWGCFTAYRSPEDVVVGHVWPQWTWTHTAAVHVKTRALLDVSVYNIYFHLKHYNMKVEYREPLKAVRAVADRVIAATSPAPWESGGDGAASNKGPYRVVDGEVVAFTYGIGGEYIGLIWEEFLSGMTRFWTAGVFDRPNITLVVPRSDNEADHAMRAWLVGFLPVKEVIWLRKGEAIRARRAWFAITTAFEDAEPCRTNFISLFLLPRILAAVRRDPTFHFGNRTMRTAANVSDVEWAATFPRKVAIIKQNKNARHNRGFSVRSAGRRLFSGLGYVWVADNAPFTHRIALVNFAEVVATTFGSLLAMLSGMYGGGESFFRPGEPLRVISLMHRGYHNELGWWVPGPCRVGTQDGLRVAVSDRQAVSARYIWSKNVKVMGSSLDTSITKAHLTFEAADCTIDPSKAKDFVSTAARWWPGTETIHLHREFNRTWHFIPKAGQRCPFGRGF